ncbi:MepB family protein [Agrobacterium sp. 22-222-1]
MTSSKSALNPFQGQLNDAIRDVYEYAGMRVTYPVQSEAESAEYGACRFGLDGHAIAFRIAKTTPTKIGQFVTIWKRPTPDSEIAPLDITDGVQFVVVSVSDAAHRGQFIFNQKLLIAKGVMSRNGKGGKRAIRVYPPWSIPTAKDAIRTQQWQTQHFLPLAADGTAESPEQVRKLFQA